MDAQVELVAVDPTDPRAVDAVAAYVDELDERFPGGFVVDGSLTADADHYRRPRGTFVLALRGDDVVGCGAVTTLADDLRDPAGPAGRVAEVKRMWVASDARGAGLGRRLLAHLEELARAAGHVEVVLDTNATLVTAIAMYERAGYHPTPRYNANPYAERWLAKPLG